MTAKTFVRFDRLSEDFVRGKHDWFDGKLKLVLLAEVPEQGAASVGRGVHSVTLKHTAAREGRVTALNIEPVLIRAEGQAIGPYKAVAIVSGSGAPIGFIDVGERLLEEGSSTQFKFPPDVVMVTA